MKQSFNVFWWRLCSEVFLYFERRWTILRDRFNPSKHFKNTLTRATKSLRLPVWTVFGLET